MKVAGSVERPRLSVFRSLQHIYAQLVDDSAGNTLVAASSLEKEVAGAEAKLTRAQLAAKVGEVLATRAKDRGFKLAVFDRSGYPYHGRVKLLAEGARKAGLEF
jgi:large subunit ribosomal protein L18